MRLRMSWLSDAASARSYFRERASSPPTLMSPSPGTAPPVSLFPPFMLSPGDSPRPSVVVSVPLVSGWVVMLPLGVVSGRGEGFLLSASPQAASVTASISAAASAINRSVISVPPFPVLAPHAKNTLITRAVHS